MNAVRDPRTHVAIAFFRDGHLTAVPRRGSYREAALTIVAERFQRGRRYDERDVNAMLAGDGPDHATLRRLLIDDGLLVRDHGSYWRP